MSVETINSLQDYIAAVERTLDASCSEEVSLMRGAICDIEAAEDRCEKMRAVATDVLQLLETFYEPQVHYKNESWDLSNRVLPVGFAMRDLFVALKEIEK